MTPKERFQSALELRSVDRPPVFYQHLGASSYLQSAVGCTIKDAFSDPEKYSDLVMASYERFGFDNVMIGWGDLLTEAQAHGLKWKFTDPRFYPRPDIYLPLDKAGEIQSVDPARDPFWSVQLKAGRKVVEEKGREVAVVGSCVSPTWIASETIGMENLLMAYFQQPDLVHSMLRTFVQSCRAYGERVLEAGMEDIFVDDSGGGGEMVSMEMYGTFDRAYLIQVMSHWRNLGLRTIIHNDSAEPFYGAQADLGPSALHVHLQAVDTPKFFNELKGRLCVMAGIDHMTLLFKKSPDEVEAEVERILSLWGDEPGFMVAPGCELPYKTPLENIKRLKEAVVRHYR
ncbi:MAG: hypothetical protein LUQ16_02635 [Methanomassiliicoccales archaeon]|nr:hypothetical protein [Methanomassiliicoccales archaeon]MDD1756564.1 hypothetical protein [Methanomassiliicoccales archaeon]